ncbi:methyl-accepting chemotaxis protein [Ramlibacter sp. AN1133]|uniref:methyl-accepting chemotaxis protein n=1 Tax=Ramlibacter sp. AN1133 TaxID=3133429 RepID=UPI0030C19A2A
MSLQSLSVRTRLGAGFGLVLLLLVGVVLVSLLQLASFNRNVDALSSTRLVQLITVAQASNALGHISRSTGNVLVLDDEKQVKEELANVRANQASVQELLAKVDKTISTERERTLLGEIATAREAYLPHENEFLKDADHGDYSSAKDVLLKTMRPAQIRLIEAMERFEDHQVALSADEARKASDAYHLTRNIVLGMAAAAVLLGVLLSWRITASITRPIGEAEALARRVADGDLTVQVKTAGRDELGRLLQALGQMAGKLRQVVGEVATGAHQVADASAQIAQGNQELSTRTEEQASTLEETASSMQQFTSSVTQNAEHARDAARLANGASEVARKGGEVVGQVVNTMHGISEASRRIADIIGVIDGIAFQTNILALNAAVEAARAGDQGRGFAVVAGEVRNLAQRSAAAAKEIKELIGDSAGKVENGAREVANAGATMDEIVRAVAQVSELIAEIAAASREQSAGIEQVSSAVTQMDQVVQHNASLVEEAAAATDSMKAQAASLLVTVSHFRLDDDAAALEAAPAPAVHAAAAPAPIRVRAARPALAPLPQPPGAPAQPGPNWREF